MDATRERLRKQFATLDQLVAGIEQGRRSWHDFWPSLTEIQALIQQRQPGGSRAGDASLELGRAATAARSRDTEQVRSALDGAQMILKLAEAGSG